MKLFCDKLKFLILVNEYSCANSLLTNRLALDCFLWGLSVLDLEEVTFNYSDQYLISSISNYINANISSYSEEDSNFAKSIMTRYAVTAKYFEEMFNINLNVFVNANHQKKGEIQELRTDQETSDRLNDLESLRLNKPEPSRNSIEDIIRTMQRRRFLVRPSYQRKEVINISKASSIIESVILGISLPAIFIYKRRDGASEVIDGQQRILTLLGFIGQNYINENGDQESSRNHHFSLRKMRILRNLEKKKYEDLDEDLKNKILA